MFRKKITITRPDRDRLLKLTGPASGLVGWTLFAEELLAEIRRAAVVEPPRVRPDVVTMHSRVRIRDAARRAAETYTLVYPEEADIARGRLSVLAPLGTALIGEREGRDVTVPSAAGPRTIRIEEIVFQPEAGGAGGARSAPSAGGPVGQRLPVASRGLATPR
jgi:regulator of nucleoside diphosphate kinase